MRSMRLSYYKLRFILLYKYVSLNFFYDPISNIKSFSEAWTFHFLINKSGGELNRTQIRHRYHIHPQTFPCFSCFSKQQSTPFCRHCALSGLIPGTHIRLERQETDRWYRLILRLLDGRSKLTLQIKLLIHNTIVQPTPEQNSILPVQNPQKNSWRSCQRFQPHYPKNSLCSRPSSLPI